MGVGVKRSLGSWTLESEGVREGGPREQEAQAGDLAGGLRDCHSRLRISTWGWEPWQAGLEDQSTPLSH